MIAMIALAPTEYTVGSSTSHDSEHARGFLRVI